MKNEAKSSYKPNKLLEKIVGKCTGLVQKELVWFWASHSTVLYNEQNSFPQFRAKRNPTNWPYWSSENVNRFKISKIKAKFV